MQRPSGRRGLRRDGGASTVEYGAVIILVSVLLATVGFVVVPERVRSGTLSAICRLFGGEGCGDVKGVAAAQPRTDPSPGLTVGPPAPVGPTAPVDPNAVVDPAVAGLDLNDPDVQRYNNAKTENTNADQAVTDAQAGADEVLKQLKDFLLDVVGWIDLQKCVTSGDIVACISTLINIVPWGKVFKLLKKIPGAIRLAQRLLGAPMEQVVILSISRTKGSDLVALEIIEAAVKRGWRLIIEDFFGKLRTVEEIRAIAAAKLPYGIFSRG